MAKSTREKSIERTTAHRLGVVKKMTLQSELYDCEMSLSDAEKAEATAAVASLLSSVVKRYPIQDPFQEFDKYIDLNLESKVKRHALLTYLLKINELEIKNLENQRLKSTTAQVGAIMAGNITRNMRTSIKSVIIGNDFLSENSSVASFIKSLFNLTKAMNTISEAVPILLPISMVVNVFYYAMKLVGSAINYGDQGPQKKSRLAGDSLMAGLSAAALGFAGILGVSVIVASPILLIPFTAGIMTIKLFQETYTWFQQKKNILDLQKNVDDVMAIFNEINLDAKRNPLDKTISLKASLYKSLLLEVQCKLTYALSQQKKTSENIRGALLGMLIVSCAVSSVLFPVIPVIIPAIIGIAVLAVSMRTAVSRLNEARVESAFKSDIKKTVDLIYETNRHLNSIENQPNLSQKERDEINALRVTFGSFLQSTMELQASQQHTMTEKQAELKKIVRMVSRLSPAAKNMTDAKKIFETTNTNVLSSESAVKVSPLANMAGHPQISNPQVRFSSASKVEDAAASHKSPRHHR